MQALVSREWVFTEAGPNPSTLRYVAQGRESRRVEGRWVKGRWWMEWVHISTEPAGFEADEKVTWHKMHLTWFPKGSEPWTLARIAKKEKKKGQKQAAPEALRQ